MRTSKKRIVSLVSGLLIAGLLAGCGGGSSDTGNVLSSGAPDQSEQKVTISYLVNNVQSTVEAANALVEAFQAKHPNITVEIETYPAGSEGDNLVKTKLATGDMTDVFLYNSGSLMQALNPEKNLLDLTDEAFQENVVDSYKPTVSFNGKIYAAPISTASGGGWFYNKKVYADLNLSVPKTWDELMANNDKIKAAGITPIIGTYKDSFTSQLIVLSDFFNVQSAESSFAADYTANKAKYATTPAALRSFQKLEQTVGYMNKDFLALTLDNGLKMLAEGTGAHYPMLTQAIPSLLQNYPDKMDDIGFFAQPGDDAETNGLTVWMSAGVYIYKNSKHIEASKTFLSFIASVEGTEAMGKAVAPTGPYFIKGAKLPDGVPQIVTDMLPYFESDGATAPALEFLSPIKGPNLMNITVEVGAGMRSAADGAAMYDKDVEKQAQQLGLEGW